MATVEIDFDITDIKSSELISEIESRGYTVLESNEDEHGDEDEMRYFIEKFKRSYTKRPIDKEELKKLICDWIDDNINKTIF